MVSIGYADGCPAVVRPCELPLAGETGACGGSDLHGHVYGGRNGCAGGPGGGSGDSPGDRRGWGAQRLWAGSQLGTIPYEILCSISKRIPRIYLDGKKRTEILQYIV